MKPIYAVISDDADLDSDYIMTRGAIGVTKPERIPDGCKVVQIRPDQAPSHVVADALEIGDEFPQMIGFNRISYLKVDRFTKTMIVCLNGKSGEKLSFTRSRGKMVGSSVFLNIPSADKMDLVNRRNKEGVMRRDVINLVGLIERNIGGFKDIDLLHRDLRELVSNHGLVPDQSQ